ncbi:NAD(P)H-binding protein [Sediminibacter sp. Hel_I_10]|uniref:NAD(P)H-binding protein n=1 Tax=Sediminibacter sp. Hel_I_10 TaxID=1392490 RepID=UPI000479F045|nr:NAD(P)H-binding protein [Sediminibacter sp. Hel_I_10]
MNSITIGVLGATGLTGRHVVNYALEQGYNVQALVRNPSKIKIKNDKLKIVKGDFENVDALKETVHGANYVICCAGGTYGKDYDKGMMTRFIECLWPILDNELSLKAFLYQSVFFAPKPDGSNPMLLKLLAPTAAFFTGATEMLKDNTTVTKFMASNKKDSFDYIITRPGKLVDKKGSVSLVASSKPSFDAISFEDLGVFNVKTVVDETLYGSYPFVAVKK